MHLHRLKTLGCALALSALWATTALGSDTPAPGGDFRGRDWTGRDLQGVNLEGACLDGAVLTGVGGGIMRDLLLDVSPPNSIQHWPNITVALAAAAVATVFARAVIRMNRLVLILDAIGMGFFATSGAAIRH